VTTEVLSAAGLTLYEQLVSARALPLHEITDQPAVHELIEAGFARLDNESQQLLPIAPVLAFEQFLAGLQAEFLNEQRQLLEAYNYLDGLQRQSLENRPAAETNEPVEIRPGDGEFVEAIRRLVAGAKVEVLSWNVALQQFADSLPRDVSLHLKTVYDAEFLHRSGGAALLRRARAAGEEMRIADELAGSMLIADSTAVLLPLGVRSSGALTIGSPLVVDAMREFFDLVWLRSVPWIERDGTDELLTPVQRQVVALMAVGHSDEELAEHLGVSLRTVRRYVAEVMEALHADTRFTAGIAAAQAGLLDDTNYSSSSDL
jgi:DNA-binding CsgD family transcriptional regulator